MKALIISITALAIAAVGATLGILAAAQSMPQSLTPDQRLTSVAVTKTDYEDPRQVELSLNLGPIRSLASPASGRLTSSTCAVGSDVVSGSTSFGVDGVPVVSLATSVPLWRDIAIGDSGADVSALQAELGRLGQRVGVDGTWGPNSHKAYAAVMRSAISDAAKAPPLSATTVETARIAWLPAPKMTVSSCVGVVGTTVVQADEIAEFPQQLLSATAKPRREAIMPGERAVVIGTDKVLMPEDGVVSDAEALKRIAASDEFARARTEGDGAPATFPSVLASAVNTMVVPPAAVYDIRDSTACVQSAGVPKQVTIVASQLGRTLVTSDDPPISRVDLSPDRSHGCRK